MARNNQIYKINICSIFILFEFFFVRCSNYRVKNSKTNDIQIKSSYNKVTINNLNNNNNNNHKKNTNETFQEKKEEFIDEDPSRWENIDKLEKLYSYDICPTNHQKQKSNTYNTNHSQFSNQADLENFFQKERHYKQKLKVQKKEQKERLENLINHAMNKIEYFKNNTEKTLINSFLNELEPQKIITEEDILKQIIFYLNNYFVTRGPSERKTSTFSNFLDSNGEIKLNYHIQNEEKQEFKSEIQSTKVMNIYNHKTTMGKTFTAFSMIKKKERKLINKICLFLLQNKYFNINNIYRFKEKYLNNLENLDVDQIRISKDIELINDLSIIATIKQIYSDKIKKILLLKKSVPQIQKFIDKVNYFNETRNLEEQKVNVEYLLSKIITEGYSIDNISSELQKNSHDQKLFKNKKVFDLLTKYLKFSHLSEMLDNNNN